MAVNRIRGAFTVPRKGETFELRAGLVYETLHKLLDVRNADSGMQVTICLRTVENSSHALALTLLADRYAGKRQFKRPSWL